MNRLPEASSDESSRAAKRVCLRNGSPNRRGGMEDIDNEAEHTSDEPSQGNDGTNSEDTNMEVDPDDDSSQYMEHLVRRHLESVMDHRIAGKEPLTSRQLRIASKIAVFLEDGAAMLAHLLKAVISVRRTAEGGLARATEDFLQYTVTVSPPNEPHGWRKRRAFLTDMIGQLVRRELNDGNTSSHEHAPTSTTLSSITVLIGGSTEEIAFKDILSCFWSSKLETDCHRCRQPFEDEPPIRTITQGSATAQMSSSSSSKLCIRVFNRHFVCLKAEETFMVPVSHVWDNSIRVANESRAHNDDAALTMLDTLKVLFEGAEGAYRSNVEFWHDYFSVPQWEPITKELLLLRLPAIYHSSDEILIHMTDLPTRCANQLLTEHAIDEEITIKQAIQRIPALRDLSGCQWMQRMWVTLEYSQAKAACIMDQSNKIWRNKEVANGPFARDTFTKLANNLREQIEEVYRWAPLSVLGHYSSSTNIRALAVRKRNKERQLCLGKAMELIFEKQCQVFRDRFLAMHVILNQNPRHTDLSPIPRTDTDACSWVLRAALSRGDYSPLLLQPPSCVFASDPEPPLPSWLVGYRSVDGAEWDLGEQEADAKEMPVVTEVSVKVVLNKVGQIRAIHYLYLGDLTDVEGVNQVLQILTTMAHSEGLVLSPKDLYGAIDCVFPLDTNLTRIAREECNMVFSFDERQAQDSEFSAKLSEHLSLYTSATDERRKAQMLDAAQSIITLLQLDKIISSIEFYAYDLTRLVFSRIIAQSRKAPDASKREPLCEVRCPKCSRMTLLRLDLRVTGNVGDIVYRVPGLSYSCCVDDGVGLVLRDGRITGRMLYGKPTCNCEVQETVEIL